jgi:hypothetical protein
VEYIKVTVDTAFPAVTSPERFALYAFTSVAASAIAVGATTGGAKVVKEPTELSVLPDSLTPVILK